MGKGHSCWKPLERSALRRSRTLQTWLEEVIALTPGNEIANWEFKDFDTSEFAEASVESQGSQIFEFFYSDFDVFGVRATRERALPKSRKGMFDPKSCMCTLKEKTLSVGLRIIRK